MSCIRITSQALALVLFVIAASQYLFSSLRTPILEPRASQHVENLENSDAQLCFIIRTYWAHGPRGGDRTPPLLNMLTSLVNNAHDRWEVLLIVMDGQPFHELPGMVKNLGDQRIKIFAEKVGQKYAAKMPDDSWNPQYHDMLYELTDQAIRACSPDTRWLIISNGDNDYDTQLIPRLLAVPPDADIVALDFYSRYQRVTAAPCDRFAASPTAPPCKENLLRFCNTDLAASIYSWPRFMAEDRAFSKVESGGIGLNDGYLAQLLQNAGWKVHRITDVCLLSHSPSPQLCALHGGVWDDAVFAMFQHSGGRCLDEAVAEERLQADSKLERVEVSVSHDGSTFGFKAGQAVQLSCIRQKFEKPWQNRFYPAECAARVDGGVDP